MNIFLTGGAGYIGSAATEILLRNGHRVTVFDSLVTGHRAAVPEDARFIHADLADRAVLETALQSETFDAILHFAAFIEAGESMKEPGKYFYNNLALSLNLIEACVQAGIRRFVLSSTAAVYASSHEPLGEDSPLGPVNVYGQTKLMIEQTLEWYRQVHGLSFAALRPESHLIPLVLQVALGQAPEAKIFGTDYPTPDGTAVRDYIHITDLIDAHLLALEALKDGDQLIYNLGNGAGYSVREVIETARQVTGHPIPAVETPRRAGDAPRLVACAEKIQKDLGWQPRYPGLQQIIASAWEWHRTHPHGYLDAP
jgi:UDP-glucose 4-epimerase